MGEACAPKPETDACRSCAHRERCHGKKPFVTRDTVMQLIRETVSEVLRERAEHDVGTTRRV